MKVKASLLKWNLDGLCKNELMPKDILSYLNVGKYNYKCYK